MIPENIPLDILYEDDAVLVVNKPKGLVIHPAPGNWSHTFANALLYHCQKTTKWDASCLETLRPGIVHRLDKDTTGVLIAAKNLSAQQKLTQSFANREVYKEYLAICVGCPKSGKVEARIGRHPKIRQKMAIVPNGREALSYIENLHSEGGLSLVKVIIATGRTHQVRLHLNFLNTPVLGDPLYGRESANSKYKAERPYLHAASLRIMHPFQEKSLSLSADLPQDMKEIISKNFKSYLL
ncbi:Ribosomal large subunit pseudouridine synthase D [Chlamydiales bacterium STE3]|nr:Ribosomal large subunit pseudouridine synthase D [Chlamydiales bacterium STE3]